jgi:hypothetical protein
MNYTVEYVENNINKSKVFESIEEAEKWAESTGRIKDNSGVDDEHHYRITA